MTLQRNAAEDMTSPEHLWRIPDWTATWRTSQ